MKPLIRLRFVLLLLLVFVAASYHLFTLGADPDLWGHTKFGIDFIRNGELQKTDIYSFTADGEVWINHEWLSEVIFGKIFIWKREQGLFWFRIFILSAFIFGLIVLYWSNCPLPFLVLIASIYAIPYISMIMIVRPHSFTYLFIVFVLLLLETYRHGKRSLIWFFPPIMILWVNLHGGFVVGVSLIFFGLLFFYFGMEEVNQALTSFEKIKLLIVFILTMAATICNPYGYKLFSYLAMALTIKRSFIAEWATIKESELIYYGIFVFIPTLTLILSRGWRGRATQTLFFIVTAIATYWNVRFIILLVVFGTIIFLHTSYLLWQRYLSRHKSFNLINRPSFLILLLIMIGVIILPKTYQKYKETGMHITVDPTGYPIHATQYLKKIDVGTRLSIPFNWGEYAIWHLFPRYKVSVDGRYETVYNPEWVDTLIYGHHKGVLEKFLIGYEPDIVMIESGGMLDRTISQNKDWYEVYRDRTAVIYIPGEKLSGSNLKVIKTFRTQHFDEKKVHLFP